MADDGKAPTSTRTLWKGAISFGLVHVPVGLYAATMNSGIDFDWLDKRSMEPVGYKRVNKVTGKEISSANIVKGVEYEDGRYVVLSPEEISAAFPKTTQTIEIEAFLDADEIPFVYLERPYYTAPLKRGEKVYALLREALRKSNKVGVAKVVIQTKQHLAVLIPCGRALVLNLLRWGGEIRSFEQLNLPPLGTKAAGIRDAEMDMATQLIDDMTQTWDADSFRNSFAEEIHKLVQVKAEAGDIADVMKVEPEERAPAGADVLDLTALLKRSLEGGKGGKPAKGKDKDGTGTVTSLPAGRKKPAGKAATKTPAKKAASTSAAGKKAPAGKGGAAARSKTSAKPAAKKAAARKAA
ncbi:Ku protein [Paracidovorax wautersii]|uniref:Non-homologous end joining protein Ku n=1 Tax=Paracidovorax wautersii TaxID=1177982 RepID=A0ABU1IEE0_9BURK|nr:Ku protein [Paracidovorax wautersii]MDR6215587.1 DNA end-binding protein Ku [Paracidovorax wautersii]